MERLVFLIVLFAILATLLFLSRRQARSERVVTRVYERRHLFTKAERSFLRVLDEATGDQVRAFGKVRLDDLLQVPVAVAEGARRVARHRLARLRVDFVLCDASDLRVLAVVELGGDGDGGERTEEDDALVEEALASANIPVLRFAARSGFAVDEVRRGLEAVVPAAARAAPTARRKKLGKGAAGRRPEPVGRPAAADTTEAEQASVPVVATATGRTPAAVAAARAAASIAPQPQGAEGERGGRTARLGSCPACGRPMVERIGRRGALKGKPFLVCSGDPPCTPVVVED